MSLENWIKTLNVVSEVLNENKVDYALYGSGACVAHGAKLIPGDIDISTSNVNAAKEAFLKAESEGRMKVEELSSRSALTVRKFRITTKGGQPVELDLTYIGEFGLANANKVVKDNVKVISLVETLLSIYHRTPKRKKDINAAFELIMRNVDTLSTSVELQNRHPDFVQFIREGIQFANAELAKAKLKQATRAEAKPGFFQSNSKAHSSKNAPKEQSKSETRPASSKEPQEPPSSRPSSRGG